MSAYEFEPLARWFETEQDKWIFLPYQRQRPLLRVEIEM